MILYMYIAPGQGQKTSWGQTFDVNRKPLSLRPFVVSFKQISLNSDFIHIFLMFFHMYIASGQGQTTLCGQNLDVNRKALLLCLFVASLKQYLYSLILYIFFSFSYIYIAPGQGQTTPWGQNFYININICHSGHLL